MKKLFLASALVVAAGSANAGTAEAPKMDVTVISQSASAGGVASWVIPAIFVGLVLLLISGSTGKPVIK